MRIDGVTRRARRRRVGGGGQPSRRAPRPPVARAADGRRHRHQRQDVDHATSSSPCSPPPDSTVARIGTIEYRLGARVLPAAQTTPEAPLLQSLLRAAVDAGCTAAVMEVSSHALELRRVAEIDFDVAVFTNLSHDHLNFHPDMHHYRRAKGRLFEELAQRRQTRHGGRQRRRSGERVHHRRQPRRAAHLRRRRRRRRARARRAHQPARRAPSPPRRRAAASPSSCATSATTRSTMPSPRWRSESASALPLERIAAGLAAAPPVPGRFELVDAGQDFVVAVDYAHKPDALQRLLESARRLRAAPPDHRLRLRRRPRPRQAPADGPHRARSSATGHRHLGQPALRGPRGAIIDEILAGVRAGRPERRRAAPGRARPRPRHRRTPSPSPSAGDIVLIAGKGHEPYQLIAGDRLDFDDRLVRARRARGQRVDARTAVLTARSAPRAHAERGTGGRGLSPAAPASHVRLPVRR